MPKRPIRRVTLFGFALPDAMFEAALENDRSMPVQTHKFGWALIDSLQSAGVDVTAISCAPVTDFPHNRQLFFRGTPFVCGTTIGHSVSFVNLLGIKHLTRLRSAASISRRLARTNRPDAILVHGVNSSQIWSAIFYGRRMDVPVAVVMTDPPSLATPYDHRFSSLLKRVDRRLILAGLQQTSGVVVLTPGLAEDFAPGKPSILMEGIAVEASVSHRQGVDTAPIEGRQANIDTVVYAGGLHEAYGVANLLEATRLSRGSWCLEVYGKGPMEAEVRKAALTSERVRFGGLLNGSAVDGVLRSASLLVNPRDPDRGFVRHSFPSKLLEYLASGTPVLTTDLPTMPIDYRDHLFLSGPSATALARTIDDIMQLGPDERRHVGREARLFILRTRGIQAQGQRLQGFMASL